MNYQFLLISVVFLTLISCNKSGDCMDEEIEVRSVVDEYDCPESTDLFEVNLFDSYTIIRSQESYERQVKSNCTFTIDFTIYDLIIGKQNLSNGNDSINYKLIENCMTKDRTLTVTFIQNDTDIAPNMTYHSLVPKLGDEQFVTVELVFDY